MKIVRVVAAVIRDGDRIFATARGYGEYKGWWEFPEFYAIISLCNLHTS